MAAGWEQGASVRERTETLTRVVVVIQLMITVPLAYALNVWQDDAYTLASTSNGPLHAIHQAIYFEQNEPFYFAFMSLWRAVSHSYFFARFFSVLCAAATVYLLPKLLRRYLPEIAPEWIVVAVAFNPFLIWAAVEIRLYALVVLLSSLLLLTFHDAFLADRPSRAATIAYGVLCIIASYTQYYLIFLMLAQAVVLVGFRRWNALKRQSITGVIAAVAFVPMLATVPGQLSNFHGSFAAPRSPLTPAKTLAEVLAQYVLPLTWALHHRVLYAALLVAAVLGAVAVIARRGWNTGHDLTIVWMTSATFAIFALAVYAAKAHVIGRHGALLFVPIMLSSFAIVGLVRDPPRGRATTALALVMLACSFGALVQAYRPLAKVGDWARVTRYLASRERPGQPIVVFEAENVVPLAYYYRGPNPIIGIPMDVDFHTYDVARFVLRDGAQIDRRLARVPGEHREIWLVTGKYCSALNIDFGCGILERYVREHYTTLSTSQFYGAEVRLLRRAP